MGVIKSRRRHVFRGSVTIAGSLTLNQRADVGGLMAVSTTAAFGGTTTFSGMITEAASINQTGFRTVAAQTRVNTPMLAPAGSANTQYAGFTRLNSGATSVTISTTVVKSNALILIGAPILAAVIPTAHQASGSIPGGIVVNTITEASFFAMGWAGGVGYGAPVDIPWKIELQA